MNGANFYAISVKNLLRVDGLSPHQALEVLEGQPVKPTFWTYRRYLKKIRKLQFITEPIKADSALPYFRFKHKVFKLPRDAKFLDVAGFETCKKIITDNEHIASASSVSNADLVKFYLEIYKVLTCSLYVGRFDQGFINAHEDYYLSRSAGEVFEIGQFFFGLLLKYWNGAKLKAIKQAMSAIRSTQVSQN